MARKYNKRTRSTKRKTYNEYLEMRKQLAAKGKQLKSAMSEESYYMYYERLKNARKAGEFKISVWDEMKRKQTLLSAKQAKTYAKALQLWTEQNNMNVSGIKFTATDAYALNPEMLTLLGQFINATKHTGVYGGNYE
jgi:hypothetical protein